MRGFDIFMEVAHRVSQQYENVHFVIAGNPKTHYGSEMISLSEQSFKDHVMKKHSYDLSRFHFLDWIGEAELADVFRLSNCHFYWTVPFTLSWSLFQALSSGCLVLASDAPPVRDVMTDHLNGVLVGPNDKDTMVASMLELLQDSPRYSHHRKQARQAMLENYSFKQCLPKLAEFCLSK
jgi:glycosyltransferase involved in cell wall biosynthesis